MLMINPCPFDGSIYIWKQQIILNDYNIQYAGGDERQWQQIYLTTNLNPEWQQVQIGKMTKAGITDKFQSRNSWAFLFRAGSLFAPAAEV